MADDKLLAEWFWTDRWSGSSAFLLPIAARGLYREMLTQAWRRGARLPSDPESIRRATGVTPQEWAANWPKIRKFWTVKGDYLINETQVLVYAEAMDRHETLTNRGRKGGIARAQALRKHSLSTTQAVPKVVLNAKPPSPSLSPSLSPSPSQSPIPDLREQANSEGGGSSISTPNTKNGKNGHAASARSKRPIFTGQRITVFEWQLDDLTRLLGSHTEGFDLHEWFFTLDERMRQSGDVVPQRDGGKWLQEQTLQEAQRRGLPISTAVGAKAIATLDGLHRFATRVQK